MILNNQGKCIEWFKFYKKSIQVLDNLRNIFSMMTKSIELLWLSFDGLWCCLCCAYQVELLAGNLLWEMVIASIP